MEKDCGSQRDDENTRRTIHSRKTERLMDTVDVRLYDIMCFLVCVYRVYNLQRLFNHLNMVYNSNNNIITSSWDYNGNKCIFILRRRRGDR